MINYGLLLVIIYYCTFLFLCQMESVKTRSLEMNILMAKLHRNSGYNRGAIAFYKECLRSVSHFLSQHSLP